MSSCLMMTNQERTNAGLSALTEDAELTEIADTRALEEARDQVSRIAPL